MLVAVDDERYSPCYRGSLITNAPIQTARSQLTCRNYADSESKTNLHNTQLGLRAPVNARSLRIGDAAARNGIFGARDRRRESR